MTVTKSVVYRLYDDADRLLYVGCTDDPRSRYADHACKPWWPEVARKEEDAYQCRRRALDAERIAIGAEKPLHNVVHQQQLTVTEVEALSLAARNARDWTERRNTLIRAAFAAGGGIREIAKATRLNVGTVHTMLHEEKAMSLPRHRKPTQDEVVADLRERLDILRRKAAAVSEAWDLFIEDESGDTPMDIVADAIGSLRVELRAEDGT